ncbi:MAG: hypothetical protein HC842_06620 [Cytophagales bacterium]|nr:hypothetical protein [Cytophagales bacterium]
MNLNFLNTDYLSRTFHFADQEEEEQAKRASLIRITFLTVFFGFLWCMSYVFLGLALATTGVVLYISTTLINVLFFRITKRYVTFRFIQLVLILFLPAITQMLLGGYMKGSAVGMAIMLGPTGALMFASARTARGFFYATVAVFLGMGIWERLDPGLGIVQFSDDINLLFFATNSAAISAVFYFVIEFFLKEKDRFQHMLHDRNKEVLEKTKN